MQSQGGPPRFVPRCPLMIRLALSWLWLLTLWACSGHSPSDPTHMLPSHVANPRPASGSWVTDQAGVLGPASTIVNRTLEDLHAETGAEVAWVALTSIGAQNPRSFATELFRLWEIGSRERSDGVLVLHVLDQRRIEIETGYGLEGTLPDAVCSWLIREVAAPYFANTEFARGHVGLAIGIATAIRMPFISHDELIATATAGADDGSLADVFTRSANTARSARREEPSDTAPVGLIFGGSLAFSLFGFLSYHVSQRRLYPDPEWRAAPPWPVIAVLSVCALLSLILVGLASPTFNAWFSATWLCAFAACSLVGACRFSRKARERHRPRRCARCDGELTRLPEQDTQVMLSAGQRLESAMRVRAYDAWQCTCGELEILGYRGPQRASRCIECGFATEQRVGSGPAQAAFEDSPAYREIQFECAHCHATRAIPMTIFQMPQGNASQPRHSSSSSHGSSTSSLGSGHTSSGGGSTSSESRSFGGGRSGGGGAGGSY